MYGSAEKIIAILIALCFFGNVMVVKRYVGTSMHPSVLFNLAWFFFSLFPLIFLYDAPLNPESLLFIYLCGAFFSISALVFDWKGALYIFETQTRRSRDVEENFSTKFLAVVVIFSSVLAIVFCLGVMVVNGWELEEIFSDVVGVSGRFAALRGNVGMEYGLVGTLNVFFTYLSSVLGGLVAFSRSNKSSKLVFSAVALAPGVCTMVVQSSKLIFLISFSFFVGALLLVKLYRLELTLLRAGQLKWVLFSVASVAPFVLVSFLSRENYGDFDHIDKTIDALKYALASYALGQLYAFSDFYSYYVGMPSVSSFKSDEHALGVYTFTSIYQLFGINKEFPPGGYLETGYFEGVFETNIFTIFRGLIHDFGLAGSLIFFGTFGACINASFFLFLTKSRARLHGLIFVAAFVFIIMSYLISVFMARYMYLTVFGAWVVLKINDLLGPSQFRQASGAGSL